jgi:hypothetical protein
LLVGALLVCLVSSVFGWVGVVAVGLVRLGEVSWNIFLVFVLFLF